MPSWLGSLRVRIMVLATVAAAAALMGASVVLVWAVEQTGVGRCAMLRAARSTASLRRSWPANP